MSGGGWRGMSRSTPRLTAEDVRSVRARAREAFRHPCVEIRSLSDTVCQACRAGQNPRAFAYEGAFVTTPVAVTSVTCAWDGFSCGIVSNVVYRIGRVPDQAEGRIGGIEVDVAPARQTTSIHR